MATGRETVPTRNLLSTLWQRIGVSQQDRHLPNGKRNIPLQLKRQAIRPGLAPAAATHPIVMTIKVMPAWSAPTDGAKSRLDREFRLEFVNDFERLPRREAVGGDRSQHHFKLRSLARGFGIRRTGHRK